LGAAGPHRSDLHARVDGCAHRPTERVPAHVVVPVEKLSPPFFPQVLGGPEIEPGRTGAARQPVVPVSDLARGGPAPVPRSAAPSASAGLKEPRRDRTRTAHGTWDASGAGKGAEITDTQGGRPPGVELVDDAAVLVDGMEADGVRRVARIVEGVHLQGHKHGLEGTGHPLFPPWRHRAVLHPSLFPLSSRLED
jgi:hypothetical protein